MENNHVKPATENSAHNEAVWIEIQQKTFTNWVNEQLKSTGLTIQNLQYDFSTGVKLIALVECLQKRTLKKIRSPGNQHQSIENVQIALNAVASDNIRLVNIGSVDIVSGNLKLILGLLWQLITRYQLGKASTPPKKLMLAWFEAALPEFKITNFTKDWNDGIALAALIDFCRPGLFPNWRKLNPKFSVDNCHKAMTIARDEFHIPMLITPEDLSNPNLDEKSALTYLSYFIKENGPGYNLVIKWVRHTLPGKEVNNLTTDWNSGIRFCEILAELGAPVSETINPDKRFWENNLALAFNAGRTLGVEPPNQLKAKHFSDPNIEHISVMAYLTQLIQASRTTDIIRIIGLNLNNVFVQQEAIFKIEILADNLELECIRSEVHSPANKLVTSEITVNKFGGKGKFTPVDPGVHELKVFYKDKLAAKPMKIKIHPDLTNVIFSGIEPCSVGSLVEVVINSNGAGTSDVKVMAISSTGRELPCELTEKDNSIIANFIPDEIGEWRIAITYSGEHINGSPFPCLVYDANEVEVHLTDRIPVGETAQLSVDTQRAGWGKLAIRVECCHNSAPLPIQIDERGNGVYLVGFTPIIESKHQVHITFNQQDVRGSPFLINAISHSSNNHNNHLEKRINNLSLNDKPNKLPNNVTLDETNFTFAQIGKPVSVEIDNMFDSTLVFEVKDPLKRPVPVKRKSVENGSVGLEFEPSLIGEHVVSAEVDGQPVLGSPFICNAFDARKVRVQPPKSIPLINHDVNYEIDTTNAGFGHVEVLVNKGSVRCQTEPINKTRWLATFKPTLPGAYSVEVRFNREPVFNSPFHCEVMSTASRSEPKMSPVFSVDTIENFKVNSTSSFIIGVKNADLVAEDLFIVITEPTNASPVAQTRVVKESAHQFRAFFSVNQVGSYHFKIIYRNSTLVHAFTAKAYDISKVLISEIPKTIIVGQKCNIQVDASTAGEGQLEIAVNDGEVPNQVQVLGNGKCLISFIPEVPAAHVIDIKFNNENVVGCPIVCDVREFPDFKFDLSHVELVQVGFPLSFHVNSSVALEKKHFAIKVTSPSNKATPVNVTYGPVVTCQFVPTEVGPYIINFEYCAKLVADKPLIIKSFDPNKVAVTPATSGFVNKVVQFVVDATFAGEGNLEISVLCNEKNVPTQVQPMGGAKFGVTFTPTLPHDHMVSITFNNVPVNGNPFLVGVLPSSDKPLITGSALHFSPVDQVAKLTIHNVDSENDIMAKVQDSNNQVVSVNMIKDLPSRCINLEFVPKAPGEYKIQIKYKSEHIQGSPFSTKIYDIRKIRVKDIPEEICLGKQVTFLVEATNAGPGNLEVIVNNGKVPSTPKSLGPSLYAISFVPTEPEIHVIEIKFNGKNVENSPFRCKILDADKVMVKQIEKVAVNKVAQISVDTNGGLLSENSIAILGPSHQNLKPILLGDHLNGYQVQFNPTEVGDHAVDIKIGGNSIPGCPFLVKVYDAKHVKVTDIKDGIVGKPIYFTIDASTAGAGNLEIIVSSNGRNVPNYVQSEGNAKFRVNFKPIEASLHHISCKFNGEPVPGSPFMVQVNEEGALFGSLFSDNLLKNVSLNKGVEFKIENPDNKTKQCQILITTSSGQKISPSIEKLPEYFKVFYKPNEIGPHQVVILMDGTPVPGCPFTCNVYDVNKIKVKNLSNCVVNKPFTFLVDASQAGEGTLELVISTVKGSVRAEVLMRSRGLYDVTFLAQECVPHFLNMTFNEEDVPGSPFNINIRSAEESDHEPQIILGIINQVNIINFKSFSNNLRSLIQGPSSQLVGSIVKTEANSYKLEFLPKEVGPHKVDLFENDNHVWNKPMVVEVFDPSLVQVAILPNCLQGKECEFNVDTAKAGYGNLDVAITSDQHEVPSTMKEIVPKLYSYTFTPDNCRMHLVEVLFNKHPVPGSPFEVSVQAHLESIIIYGEGLKNARAHEKTMFFIESDGISANEFDIIVSEPNRSPLPVKCFQQKNGCLLVEWVPKKIGAHKIEVFHGDKPVIGSPFTCEVFDASKVKIEPIESSNFVINKKINLHLNRKNAGYAELDVTVTSPLGRHLPIEVKGMPSGEGELIEFVPTVPGKYKIAITYGNVEIPDSPITFIAQESILPKVSGTGIVRGLIHEPCVFVIDAKDIYGSPEIKIDGPENETSFSIEKCNDIYKVTYIPLEVGIFDIKILWNGQEIPESPFHPHIVNLEKIRVIGGWENIVDSENKFNLCLGEEKKLTFDTSEAGTGKLVVRVKHNNVLEEIPMEQTGSYKFKLTFKPKNCGDYEIYIYFEEILLGKMPIHAVVSDNSNEGATVVLRGHGLAGARVGEESEIIIDGKDAGDGEPEVSLTGVKSDIKVKLQAIGPRLYKALYTPRVPGTYLLNVLWNQKQVKGCPMKVPILPSCDAKRVQCTGDGLRGGTIGKEIKAFIDTRRAGPGELTAHCMGPTKAAICELYDQSDGTFTLLIHPQEGGKHQLTVKYGGQHVTGSPFVMKIYQAPDASKVKVIGPGIEHGVLPIYQSHFLCDTRGAGAGQLTIRIRGPKGAFRVEMQREGQRDRTIHCKYDPTEPGDYRIEVKWAGEHVPGSPFFVMIFDTQDELNRFLRNGYHMSSMISLPPLNAIERMNGPNYSEEWKQMSWKGSTADL